jgi:ankyrin repeat protein
LRSADASLDVQDINGDTPLILAAKYGHLDIVKYYIENCKMDINTINHMGKTLLMFAVQSKSAILVEYLLKKGANTTLKNRLGDTVYDIAQGLQSKKQITYSPIHGPVVSDKYKEVDLICSMLYKS